MCMLVHFLNDFNLFVGQDQVSYSWYKANMVTSQLHQGASSPNHDFSFFRLTSEYVRQVSGENLGRVTGEYVSRVTGEYVWLVTGKHFIGIAGEHVGQVTG